MCCLPGDRADAYQAETSSSAVALKIVRQPAMAIRATKMAINGGINMDIKYALAYEARCFENLFPRKTRRKGQKPFWKNGNLYLNIDNRTQF